MNEKIINESKCFVLNGNGYGIFFVKEYYGVIVNIGGDGKSVVLLNEDGRMV